MGHDDGRPTVIKSHCIKGCTKPKQIYISEKKKAGSCLTEACKHTEGVCPHLPFDSSCRHSFLRLLGLENTVPKSHHVGLLFFLIPRLEKLDTSNWDSCQHTVSTDNYGSTTWRRLQWHLEGFSRAATIRSAWQRTFTSVRIDNHATYRATVLFLFCNILWNAFLSLTYHTYTRAVPPASFGDGGAVDDDNHRLCSAGNAAAPLQQR